jgi:two-component system, LuxR family, sensor kinase FixL
MKLLGYMKSELIGRNISVIVPEPLSTSHQAFMIRYIETGREVSHCKVTAIMSM